MNAAEIITTTQCGRTFRASRRTAAHLEWTIAELAIEYPNCRIILIQTCFNVGVAASAGTHDYDAVLDVAIEGMSWDQAQVWLRKQGWAAWWRYPPTFGNHIHMVSLGYPGQVGIYVPGQVRDYYDRRDGLKGHAIDDSWHPDDIDSTIFDYPAWLAGQEDRDMANYADQLNQIQALGEANAKAIADLSARFEQVRRNTLGRDQQMTKKMRQLGLKDDQILAVLEEDKS